MAVEDYSDLNLVGYLYNTCYGGFSFSSKFVAEVNARRVQAGLEPIRSYYEERCDPMFIEVFQKLGWRASSGSAAALKMKLVPDEFLGNIYVSEYDGREDISVVESEVYSDILKKFLAERKTNPSLTLDDLEARYEATKAKLARYREFLDKVKLNRNGVVGEDSDSD
jgi:hypothetical protein